MYKMHMCANKSTNTPVQAFRHMYETQFTHSEAHSLRSGTVIARQSNKHMLSEEWTLHTRRGPFPSMRATDPTTNTQSQTTQRQLACPCLAGLGPTRGAGECKAWDLDAFSAKGHGAYNGKACCIRRST